MRMVEELVKSKLFSEIAVTHMKTGRALEADCLQEVFDRYPDCCYSILFPYHTEQKAPASLNPVSGNTFQKCPDTVLIMSAVQINLRQNLFHPSCPEAGFYSLFNIRRKSQWKKPALCRQVRKRYIGTANPA